MPSSRLLGSNKTKSSNGSTPAQSYRDDPVSDDGESVSAMSLHSNVGQFDEEGDNVGEGLPPYTDSYSDEPVVATSYRSAVPNTEAPSYPTPVGFSLDSPDVQHLEHSDKKGTRKYILSNKHTSDPVALEWAIRDQLNHQPSPYLCIYGEHNEKRYDAQKKKTENHSVTDFDIRIQMSDTHLARIGTVTGGGNIHGVFTRPKNWVRLETSSNAIRTYRGGIMKSMNKLGHYRSRQADIEDPNTEHAPSLTEWCHLFCASHYSLKSFEVRHEIVGRDDALIRSKVEEYIRATNYRGRITVSFQLCPRTLTFQTNHKLNIARHNNWMWWLCVLLQLWIITWPILFFTTKRWAVVKIVWPYSRTVSFPLSHPDYEPGRMQMEYRLNSERAFAEKWRYTIQQGVLNKERGGMILAWAGNDEQAARFQAEQASQTASRRSSEPTNGFVGGVLSLARGFGNIARERSDARGWGYDE